MSGCSQHHPTTSWNRGLCPGCSGDTVPLPVPGSAAGARPGQALKTRAEKEVVSAGTPISGFLALVPCSRIDATSLPLSGTCLSSSTGLCVWVMKSLFVFMKYRESLELLSYGHLPKVSEVM